MKIFSMFILMLAIAVLLSCKKVEPVADSINGIQDSSKAVETVTPAKVDEKAKKEVKKK